MTPHGNTTHKVETVGELGIGLLIRAVAKYHEYWRDEILGTASPTSTTDRAVDNQLTRLAEILLKTEEARFSTVTRTKV